MMKNRVLTFLLSMGIPVSAFSAQGGGCTGICGSCHLSCTPGVFALLLLGGKYFYGRLKGGVLKHE